MALEFPDLSGRRGDSIDRFILFVEQLELGIELLNDARVSRQRMALVALDNLAEVLITEFAESRFLMSDEDTMLLARTFTAAQREKIMRDFGKKVALAARNEQFLSPRHPVPLLDDFDGSIFRVAHRYRNDLYHAGRHNSALLGSLNRLYAQAVGRAFVRSLPEGWVMGGGIAGRLTQLDRFAWRDADSSGDSIAPHEAATRIVDELTRGLDIDRDELRNQLADDVQERCVIIDSDLEDLRGEGLNELALKSLIEAAQLWAAHRGDEDLIRLQEKRWSLLEKGMEKEELSEELRQLLTDNDLAQIARRTELEKNFTYVLALDSHAEWRKEGESLRKARGGIQSILERYRIIDEKVSQMEGAVDWMIMTWDRHVQLEMDIARGK